MISWFTENSLVPLVAGSFLCLAFLGLAISFRDRVMLFIALIVAALTAATVLTESLIVTDREAVTEVVYTVANAVEKNDLESVLKYVSDNRDDTRKRIRAEMPNYTFSIIRVIGFSGFSVLQDKNPKQAEIDFAVFAEGTSQGFGRGNVHRRIQLKFQKESDGVWRMIDYKHFDPRSGVVL